MKYFQLYELIDKTTYHKYGEDAWKLLSPAALEALDGLREFFNAPIMVNNWWDNPGGGFQFRGYRPPECTIGAAHSLHRQGAAFDCTVSGKTAAEARPIILENQDNPLLRNITRLEADVNWLHFDCAVLPPDKERIYVFKA